MKTAPEVLAIIPARGGSKGVPNKNLRPLGGVPLLAWTIRDARAAATVTRVVVSTDSLKIADVAHGCGAEVVYRPAHLATDEASSDSVLAHALRTLAQDPRYAEGTGPCLYRPDLALCLFPTSPFRSPELINRCVLRMIETGADSLVTVEPGHFVWTVDFDGQADAARCNAEPLNARPNRQAMTLDQRRFLEVGNVYVFRPALLLQTGGRLGGRVLLEEVTGAETVEIDTPWDFWLAEQVAASGPHARAAAEGDRA